VPRQISISEKARGKLTIEGDELWSFVFSKENELYVWLAIDNKTREIVGCYIGDRSRESAKKHWASLPLTITRRFFHPNFRYTNNIVFLY
jgi:insertion element IS1 protein InsB